MGVTEIVKTAAKKITMRAYNRAFTNEEHRAASPYTSNWGLLRLARFPALDPYVARNLANRILSQKILFDQMIKFPSNVFKLAITHAYEEDKANISKVLSNMIMQSMVIHVPGIRITKDPMSFSPGPGYHEDGKYLVKDEKVFIDEQKLGALKDKLNDLEVQTKFGLVRAMTDCLRQEAEKVRVTELEDGAPKTKTSTLLLFNVQSIIESLRRIWPASPD